ncbi:MAG: cupredoxin domain-containing protein [Acidimicrobiia bacterium]
MTLTATLVACGGSGDGSGTSAPSAPSPDGAAREVATGEVATSGAEASIVAQGMAYAPAEVTVPAGTLKVTLVNEATMIHTLLIEGVPGFAKLETATKGATDAGTLDLEPGTYTFYCDQPGHRPAGMEGKLIVA